MKFDEIKSDARRALRGLHKRLRQLLHLGLAHCVRRRPAFRQRYRRRRQRLPSALAGLQGSTTLPRPMTGRLAPGMRELHPQHDG